jgi:hypothetical protein
VTLLQNVREASCVSNSTDDGVPSEAATGLHKKEGSGAVRIGVRGSVRGNRTRASRDAV